MTTMSDERDGTAVLLPLAMGLLADVAALALVLAMAGALIMIGDTLELNPVLVAALDGLAVIGLWVSTRRYRTGRSASFAAICLAPVMLIEITRLNLQPLALQLSPQADVLGYVLEWLCVGLLFGDILRSLARIAVHRLRHAGPTDLASVFGIRRLMGRIDA